MEPCGTARRTGATRVDPKAAPRDRNQYFAGKRYLPDDEVRQLAADQTAGMWVRTRTGVSHIELRSMTLAEKAALFEERVQRRHDRHGLVSPSNLRVPGDVSTNQMRDDDNDGLWTSMYAAAECFRYAATTFARGAGQCHKVYRSGAVPGGGCRQTRLSCALVHP